MSLFTCSTDHYLSVDSCTSEQTLNPCSRSQEDFPNHDTLVPVNLNSYSDLDQPCPERNRCPHNQASTEKCTVTTKLKCSLCAKLFSSARALRRHVLSHSEQRTHVCKTCSKSFKRHDHLTGHMLTHLKPKQYLCTALGCHKSYCDLRSWKRHLLIHHGQRTVEKVIVEKPSCYKGFPVLNPSGKGVVHFDKLLAKLLQEKAASKKPIHGSSTMAPEYAHSYLNSVPSNTYPNTTNMVSEKPKSYIPSELDSGRVVPPEKVSPTPYDSQIVYSVFQPLRGLVKYNFGDQPVTVILNKPLEKHVSSLSTSVPLVDQNQNTLEPSSPNLKSSTNITLTHESLQTHHTPFNAKVDNQPLYSQDQTKHSQTLRCHCLFSDIIDRPVTPQRDIKCISGDQTVPYLKDDTSVSSVILSRIKGNRVFCIYPESSGATRKQQCADVNPLKSFTCSCNSKTDQKRHHQNSSLSKKLPVPVNDTVSESQLAMESIPSSSKLQDKRKNSGVVIVRGLQAENIHKLPIDGKKDTSDRLSAVFETMALRENDGFLPSRSVYDIDLSVHKQEGARKLKVVPNKGLEDCRRNVFPQAWESSTSVIKDPGRFVMPVSVPVTETDHYDTNKVVPKKASKDGRRNVFPQALELSTSVMKDPGRLVMPVSVPITETVPWRFVSMTGHIMRTPLDPGEQVNKAKSHLQNLNTRKRKRPVPEPLYIPPPSVDVKSSPTGYFQSNLRFSPISLYEQYPAYTPPPMLSPIRPGCGLYFNTCCSSSGTAGAPFSFPEKETSPFKKLLVKDNMVFTVQPHINIGNRFQAEIPEIKEQLSPGGDKADLVWKPMKMTNSVSKFLKLACSTAVPGGGSNLEFALHCLHLSGGNILVALDKFLVEDAHEYLPPCLADYHYAGSDHWSTAEKILFKKAFKNNGKDFSCIQGMVSQKNLSQCVEYYYTWKKRICFERGITCSDQKECSIDGWESENTKIETMSGNKINILGQDVNEMPPPNIQVDSGDKVKPLSQFPCRKCDRVFDKMQSRNAHMKKHC